MARVGCDPRKLCPITVDICSQFDQRPLSAAVAAVAAAAAAAGAAAAVAAAAAGQCSKSKIGCD